jgi:DNA-binding IclR family transcriptional regulator
MTPSTSPSREAMASHLLAAIASAALEGRRTNLELLAEEVGLRRAEARRTLTSLDQQGLVDVLRMRPTLLGFAVGQAARARGLAPLRLEAEPLLRVA